MWQLWPFGRYENDISVTSIDGVGFWRTEYTSIASSNWRAICFLNILMGQWYRIYLSQLPWQGGIYIDCLMQKRSNSRVYTLYYWLSMRFKSHWLKSCWPGPIAFHCTWSYCRMYLFLSLIFCVFPKVETQGSSQWNYNRYRLKGIKTGIGKNMQMTVLKHH